MFRDGVAFTFSSVRDKTGFGMLNPVDESSKIARNIAETHSVKS
jgi:hypothetical protein